MHTFQDPVCGEIAVTHSGPAITIDFERLETGDAILPLFTVSLGTEHVAAWIASLLTDRGRTCTRCEYNAHRLQLLLDLTRADPRLVYCIHRNGAIILVRDGRVLKTGFRHTSMDDFLHSIREQGSSDRTPTSEAFARFARGLIDPI